MRRILALVLAGGLALSPAQGQSYRLQESAVSGGGGTVQNNAGSLTLTSSVGQAVTGTQQGSTLVLYSGYPAPVLETRGMTVQVETPLSGAAPAGKAVPVVAHVTSRRSVQGVTLHYRIGGETAFEEVPMEVAGSDDDRTTYEGAIPAEAITERGIAFYVEAEDGDRTARGPSTGVNSFAVRVGDQGIEKGSSQPSGTESTAYRLISVPIDLDAKRPSDVLEDDLEAYDATKWRFFEGVHQAGAEPTEYPDTRDVTPGRAFWLIVRDDVDPIDTGAGEVLSIGETFSVELTEGWNYVANPFNFPIPLANLRRDSGEPVALYRYDGSWSAVTDAGADLPPFAGFAIESSDTDQLSFDPMLDGGSSAARAKMLAASEQTTPSWSIRIAGRSGAARDEHHVAAVAPDAEDGLDAMDWPEPPAPGAGLAVRFVRPDWPGDHARYLVDVREEPRRGVTWSFEVTTTRRRPVTLTFGGLARVPESFEVWLLDDYSKASQDLRATPRYTIEDPPSGEARSFRLVVGQQDYVKQTLEAAGALPATYALADIYPNPTRGASTIRYGLPAKQDVTITVYNVLGQKVATLMQGEPTEPGFHTVQWDGQGGGAPVASGVYFVRMRAGDFTASKKIVRVN